MPEFVDVLALSELAPGSAREVWVSGKAVALFNVEGSVYAIGNTCQHRGGPLGQGMLDGYSVLCPWHAWAYDVRTGISTVNEELRVPRYETRVEGDRILVSIA
jgi:nitrite reductase/ring-hydroxylating ferredoxin subunit